FNDARVIPARFMLQKTTGGRVEGLYLGLTEAGEWRVMLKNLGPFSAEAQPTLKFAGAEEISATVISKNSDGTYLLRVSSNLPALELLERVGRMPLPPYIKRDKEHDTRDADDRDRYQTVYANAPGSVAAPTAGLHFTDELLRELEDR